MNQPIYTFAKWQAKKDALQTVLDLLPALIEKTTSEEGNLFYKIYQSTTEANTLVLCEGYKDEASLAAHRESAHFQQIVVGQIVPLLEKREIIVAAEINAV